MIDPAALRPLLAAHWYDAVADLMSDAATDLDPPRIQRAREVATCAKRVLELDAEDFHDIAAAADRPWSADLDACAFPQGPRDEARGALASLVPLYELMLEVVELRAERRENLMLVVTCHILGEFLPQLAWEPVLGHGGDPALLVGQVGERWGSDDRTCCHSRSLRAAARRTLNAVGNDVEGFTAYLDRFHSRQGNALAVCAMNHETVGAGERPDVGDTCQQPCAWALRGSPAERRALDARCRLALMYQDSPLVALRHHAPVGHFFGVPSRAEISEAWIRTWEKVSAPWPDGENPLSQPGAVGADAAHEALPGLSALVSAVAGRPISAGHLIRRIGADIATILTS